MRTLEAVDSASRLFRPLTPDERALLRELKDYAREASARRDSKAQCLFDWLNKTLKSDGRWNNERVLILTEYRTAQKWLQGLFEAAGLGEGDRLMTIYGGMKSEDRERVKSAFRPRPHLPGDRIYCPPPTVFRRLAQ